MDANIKRIAVLPGARRSIVGGGGGPSHRPVPPANLSRNPKDLYILWAEYMAGLAGNKPAREFNAAERGKVKFKYSNRKIVWDTIENMCTRNISSDVAIDTIYEECGGHKTPVNQVISFLRDARRIGNQNLYIVARHT